MWQKRVLLSAMLTAAVGAGVFAQPPRVVIDQANAPASVADISYAIGGQSDQYLAQTVTVGVAGRLWEVRLPVGCATGDLVLEIRDVGSDGKPGTRVLRQLTFDAASNPELYPPSLTSEFRILRVTGRPLNFAVGDTFAIVVANAARYDGSCGLWPGNPGNTYAGGQGWFQGDSPFGRVWNPISIGRPDEDLPFQTMMFR
jgi:hypothetical protein